MAAGEADLTLDEIDALIDASPTGRILIVAHWTWFLIQEAGRHLKTRNNGGLNYRGLDVWISGSDAYPFRALTDIRDLWEPKNFCFDALPKKLSKMRS